MEIKWHLAHDPDALHSNTSHEDCMAASAQIFFYSVFYKLILRPLFHENATAGTRTNRNKLLQPVVRPPQYAPAPVQVMTWTATQSFQVRGHHTHQWCGSSYSISIPSLKIVGLPILKIWKIFSYGINQPGDLDLWQLDRQWPSMHYRIQWRIVV